MALERNPEAAQVSVLTTLALDTVACIPAENADVIAVSAQAMVEAGWEIASHGYRWYATLAHRTPVFLSGKRRKQKKKDWQLMTLPCCLLLVFLSCLPVFLSSCLSVFLPFVLQVGLPVRGRGDGARAYPAGRRGAAARDRHSPPRHLPGARACPGSSVTSLMHLIDVVSWTLRALD
eukprot:1591320-Rhodomonas_salina.1